MDNLAWSSATPLRVTVTSQSFLCVVVVSQCCEEATTTKERSTTNEPKVYSLSVRKKRWAQLRQLDVST